MDIISDVYDSLFNSKNDIIYILVSKETDKDLCWSYELSEIESFNIQRNVDVDKIYVRTEELDSNNNYCILNDKKELHNIDDWLIIDQELVFIDNSRLGAICDLDTHIEEMRGLLDNYNFDKDEYTILREAFNILKKKRKLLFDGLSFDEELIKKFIDEDNILRSIVLGNYN